MFLDFSCGMQGSFLKEILRLKKKRNKKYVGGGRGAEALAVLRDNDNHFLISQPSQRPLLSAIATPTRSHLSSDLV